MGGLYGVLVVVTLVNAPKGSSDQMNTYYYSLILVLVPALLFIFRGFLHKTVITINASGIYQYGMLITAWKDLVNARITEEDIADSISDNFVLLIDYYSPERGGYFERKIPLTSTQTKSEEEIMEAINFFLELKAKESIAGTTHERGTESSHAAGST